MKSKILQYLTNSSSGQETAGMIAEAIGAKPASVRKCLTRLCRTHELIRLVNVRRRDTPFYTTPHDSRVNTSAPAASAVGEANP